MSIPRPQDHDETRTIVSASEMEFMYHKQRVEVMEEIVGQNCVVSRRGFVDTTRGMVHTSNVAISILRIKSAQLHEKGEAGERKK